MNNSLSVLIPIVLFFLLDCSLLFSAHRQKINTAFSHTFNNFILGVWFTQGLTIILYACDLNVITLSIFAHYLVVFLSSLGINLSAYFWFEYLIFTSNIPEKYYTYGWRFLRFIPVLLSLIISATTQITHWMFYIDEDNIYHVGIYSITQTMGYFYLFFAIGVIIIQVIKKQFQSSMIYQFCIYVIPASIGTFLNLYVCRGGYAQIGCSFGAMLMYIELYLKEVDENRRLRDVEERNKTLTITNEEQEATIEEITALNDSLFQSRQQLETRYNIINAMTSMYYSSYYIDIVNDTYMALSTKKEISSLIAEEGSAQEALYIAADKMVEPEYRDKMREFWNLSTVNERLKDTNAVSCKYKGRFSGWSMANLIAGDRDEAGNVLHVFYAARVINDEQKREAEYIARLEDLDRIISGAGLGIWHVFVEKDKALRMRANEKMLELMGIEDKDITEEEVYDFWNSRVLPESRASIDELITMVYDGKFYENTYRWNHPKYGAIYVRCGGRAEVFPDGTKILSGYHSDVNSIVLKEEKRKEELAKAMNDAKSANQAKTSFLLNMSHDIRTPLNAILGYTELIEKHIDERDCCLGYADKIKHSGDFLLSLINNVLDLARIESGREIVSEEPIRVETICEQVESVYSATMNSKDIKFTQSTEFFSDYMYGDLIKLKEIVLNLVSNAYKYTPSGGSISIDYRELKCEKEGYGIVQTTVKDTGIGMSEEFIPTIFDEFTREHDTTESKIQGTGLGMPIVKKYVELMGGTITVSSAVGKGTTIIVKIPHRIADATDIKEKKTYTASLDSLKGKRILLAEDNDLNAEIAMAIIEEMGVEVERAEDGIICVDMLQKAEAGYYDLILMDILMPNMNGYLATRKIRQLSDKDKADITIFAMTANAFEEDKRDAFEAGMDGHISKPIKPSDLMSILGEFFASKDE